MSDNQRCEPPEGLRGQDGWYWLTYPDAPDEPAHWQASNQSWLLPGHDDYVTPDFMRLDESGTRYLAPVATPAEVEALRAERDAEKRRSWKSDADAAHLTGKLATLRAEGKRLRDALVRIAGGDHPEGTSLAVNSNYRELEARLRAIARAALGPTP